MPVMCIDHRSQAPARDPGRTAAVLLSVLLIIPFGAGALAATKPTTVLKPPVQSAATGNLKTSRQALLKQRTSLFSPNTRHPGKIVGASTPAPKTIVTKRFLPK
jgi:hypothetical protein